MAAGASEMHDFLKELHAGAEKSELRKREYGQEWESKDNDADDEGNGVDDGFYTVGTGAIGRRTSVCVNGN